MTICININMLISIPLSHYFHQWMRRPEIIQAFVGIFRSMCVYLKSFAYIFWHICNYCCDHKRVSKISRHGCCETDDTHTHTHTRESEHLDSVPFVTLLMGAGWCWCNNKIITIVRTRRWRPLGRSFQFRRIKSLFWLTRLFQLHFDNLLGCIQQNLAF